MKKYFTVLILIIFLVACQKFASPDPNGSSSKHTESESHNNGKNCMDCHYSAGYAEGIFTVAGSAVGNYQNSNIELYNDQSVLVKTIQVDELGNFYTPDDVDFSKGLHVGIRSQNGEFEEMDDKIFHGQCSLCHGTPIEEAIEAE